MWYTWSQFQRDLYVLAIITRQRVAVRTHQEGEPNGTRLHHLRRYGWSGHVVQP